MKTETIARANLQSLCRPCKFKHLQLRSSRLKAGQRSTSSRNLTSRFPAVFASNDSILVFSWSLFQKILFIHRLASFLCDFSQQNQKDSYVETSIFEMPISLSPHRLIRALLLLRKDIASISHACNPGNVFRARFISCFCMSKHFDDDKESQNECSMVTS
jgi:hypothetical protein